jgi:putative secretion ATPase (PEP-CTERM system associated)
MYESFYGLKAKPFQLNPDPSFYFASKQHARARAFLEYGLHQNEGFIVITGEVGAGKTTIVRSLLERLDSAKVLAATLVSTQVDAEDTLRLIAAAFGVRVKDVSKADLLMNLEAYLLTAAQQGKRCLLIVDEAQNLTPRAVEELRMLSNFQIGNRALLQSFLVGQPEFREILQSPHMLQLRQRVIASCHIGPLMKDETRGYIEHRLKCAGWTGSTLFSDEACDAVYRVTGGIPRRTNTVCDRVMLMGCLTNRKEFSAEDVEDVAREILEETMGVNSGGRPSENSESTNALAQDAGNFEIDMSKLDLGGRSLEEASNLVATLAAGQVSERILRLERSLLRIERINSASLALLQQIVASMRVQPKQIKSEEK